MTPLFFLAEMGQSSHFTRSEVADTIIEVQEKEKSAFHPFIPQVVIEKWLWAQHCVRNWGHRRGKD
jgi:hypothetical protein